MTGRARTGIAEYLGTLKGSFALNSWSCRYSVHIQESPWLRTEEALIITLIQSRGQKYLGKRLIHLEGHRGIWQASGEGCVWVTSTPGRWLHIARPLLTPVGPFCPPRPPLPFREARNTAASRGSHHSCPMDPPEARGWCESPGQTSDHPDAPAALSSGPVSYDVGPGRNSKEWSPGAPLWDIPRVGEEQA